MKTSRRQFLGAASALVTGSLLSTGKVIGMPAILRSLGDQGSLINGVQIGVITYSFREMPDQSAEATLDYVKKAGISAIELMGGPAETFAGSPKNPVDMRTMFPLLRKRWEKAELTADEKKTLADFDEKMNAYRAEVATWRTKVSMDKFEQMGKMYKQAGVSIYAFKPDAFGMQNTDAEIDWGLRAGKALGASHVTLEHPANDAHTLKLGKAAEKYGMKIGYHGHEQQTPTFWDTALEQSPANALNLDLGHYVAAGNAAPLDIIKQKGSRIMSMHMKDRKNKANGGTNMPWGEGNTPLVDALKLMQSSKFGFPGTIELEYNVPAGSNPVEEVKKCLEYCRKALG